MKKIILFILFINLYALNIVSLSEIPGMDTKVVKSFKDIDFSKSVAVVPADYIEYVMKHKNIRIVEGLGREDGVIVSHNLDLPQIKTLANANLAIRIVLGTVNKHYKEVNGTYKDFLNDKIDAIYLKNNEFYLLKNREKAHFLKKFIYFPKYILIGDVKYLKKHKTELENLNLNNATLLFNALVLSKYYLKSDEKYRYLVFFKAARSKLYKVLVTPNWKPFVMKNANSLTGIGIEFWKLIAKKAGVGYYFIEDNNWGDVLEKIKNNEADLTPNTSITKERKKYALFSKPYVSFPLGIICKNGLNISNISDIKSLAVGKHYTAESMMKNHYPGLTYVETKNTKEALDYVRKGKAECAVDILPSILWYTGHNNLKIYFKTPFTFDVRVMLSKNNKKLLTKINKAIDSITESEKKEILSKYYSYVIEKESHTISWMLVGGFVFILILGVVWIKRLQKEADTDDLTTVLNRGAIDEVMEKELKEKRGSIVFMDLDKFKNINDKYGHDKGDLVLKEFAEIIKKNIRKSDYFGRWGGEEFLLILPNVSFEEAMKVAEKLRKEIENANMGGLKVTSSFGVTEFNQGDSLSEIMKKADMALYDAKNSGRNQVKGIK
jgi:diguanylate cyclase (GGDEF)-like protein